MVQEMIRLEKVTKAFSGVPVITNLSFSVNPGEILGFLGPNGSGKTTAIRLLNGVIDPDSGQITAAENLLFFADLYGVSKPKKRVEELLNACGLSPHAHKKVAVFSTVMKKRLGIAKAHLHQPEILFLDEPTTGLDPEGARALFDYIKELNRRYRVTIVLATHLLKQVEELCHRFIKHRFTPPRFSAGF